MKLKTDPHVNCKREKAKISGNRIRLMCVEHGHLDPWRPMTQFELLAYKPAVMEALKKASAHLADTGRQTVTALEEAAPKMTDALKNAKRLLSQSAAGSVANATGEAKRIADQAGVVVEERPDASSYTIPDGECVSTGPCMHTPTGTLYVLAWPLDEMPDNRLTWTDRETISAYLMRCRKDMLVRRAKEHGIHVVSKTTKAELTTALMEKVEVLNDARRDGDSGGNR